MGEPVRRAALSLAIALGWTLSFGLIAAAPAVRAASPPTFELGTLSSSFPAPVSWRFTFRSDADPTRIELLTRLAGSDLVFVSIPTQNEVTRGNDGSWIVAGADDTSVTPNTQYHARLRVTTADDIFLGPEASVLVSDDRFPWQVRESDRLRLHWYSGNADFAARALKVGDDGVTKAEDFMGVHLSGKVDIFVYADDAPFRDAIGPGSPENAAGVPFSSIETFFALIRPEQIDSSWVGVVVPHELTHLVLGAAIGPGVGVPLWLNEGLAVYLSTGDTGADKARVRDAIANGTLVPLDGLTGDFPSDSSGARSIASYSESVSAIDFMVRTYGQARIAKLIAAFATQGADDAFRSALGTDTAAFQAAWLDSLGASAPQVFGPRPAPTGPLPSDWLGSPPAAGLLPAESASPGPSSGPGAAPASGRSAGAVALVILGVTATLAVLAVAAALGARRRREG